LIAAARDAGFKLYVVDGVVEEALSHIERALACARTSSAEWHASVPFLYSEYVSAGAPANGFADWLLQFRGSITPRDDLIDYLEDVFGIERRPLTEEVESAPIKLRSAVQEIWIEAHQRRRAKEEMPLDGATMARLVEHDVENCVGVIQLRTAAGSQPMGYRHWWLTLDRVAFTLGAALANWLGNDAPKSPALSPDFLIQLFRLGPLRAAIERDHRLALPVVTYVGQNAPLPTDLLAVASDVRERYRDQPERVVARQVRDELNTLRWARIKDDPAQ
jgi:hypothetical protein